ncbi:MAG: VOC family protein [Sphingomonas sp.]
MQIRHVLMKVDDQDKALAFYTEILGFEVAEDRPGEIRWLTVKSPEGADGVELVLEPSRFAPGLAAQKALYDGGFPATVLSTMDVRADYARLSALGVVFRGVPRPMGPVVAVPFEDTCGNLIMLVQQPGESAGAAERQTS